MARAQIRWADFGWQGIRLRVPEEWNLGRVEGNHQSGYVRLDDAELVRAECEWRMLKEPDREPLEILVDRYLSSLQRKAQKGKISFSVQRHLKFRGDQSWLAGREWEVFSWEADYRAHNLALKTDGGRVALVRLLSRLDERPMEVFESVCRSLEDQFRQERWFWSVYGLSFWMPAEFRLESHELRSGHIQLSFEQQDKQLCRIQRLSLARLLLKEVELVDWYPAFFRKQLREMDIQVEKTRVRGHPALRVSGRPKSRWRQLLRPLPWVNPRPRLYQDSRVWHCEEADKICVVDHLYRREEQRGDLAERLADGYICHQQETEVESRGHVGFATCSQ